MALLLNLNWAQLSPYLSPRQLLPHIHFAESFLDVAISPRNRDE